jgi:hypothetical protein
MKYICVFCLFETDNMVCPRCVDYKGMVELTSPEGQEAVKVRKEQYELFHAENERAKMQRDIEVDAGFHTGGEE